jgi:peptide chain release factor 3
MSEAAREIARRRTFAIVSHPDAGKTTLTEKLLLYGGALASAGSVRAGRNQRAATSDWMEIERQRGISITSTVLAFDYGGCRVNLLDTPGHADFSEDTYRTLVAADSAVIVLDAARGVEAQTLKLFKVARQMRLPVFTFVNKMDRPAMEPLALLDIIERDLEIEAVAVNWPIGDGPEFQGVYDRQSGQVHRYDRVEHGARRAPVALSALGDAALDALVGAEPAARLRSDVELIDSVGPAFSPEQVAAGAQTPVFFGSALTNFGVDLFLDRFVELAPPPLQSPAAEGGDDAFAGFVFKIQSNMNPQHRDSVAFVRITRGTFARDEVATHGRTGRTLRLGHATTLFARERQTVDVAYAGDVIGVANPGLLAIGDTLYSGSPPPPVELPTFPPEHFARLQNVNVLQQKAYLKGLDQLGLEGVVQVLAAAGAGRREGILAAVGRLQFDVMHFRMKSEYGVDTVVEVLPYRLARWLFGPEREVAAFVTPTGCLRCEDALSRPVVLFGHEWDLDYCTKTYPALSFREAETLSAVDVERV